jgi:hypothetical protein
MSKARALALPYAMNKLLRQCSPNPDNMAVVPSSFDAAPDLRQLGLAQHPLTT